jgi:hypothetical protein
MMLFHVLSLCLCALLVHLACARYPRLVLLLLDTLPDSAGTSPESASASFSTPAAAAASAVAAVSAAVSSLGFQNDGDWDETARIVAPVRPRKGSLDGDLHSNVAGDLAVGPTSEAAAAPAGSVSAPSSVGRYGPHSSTAGDLATSPAATRERLRQQQELSLPGSNPALVRRQEKEEASKNGPAQPIDHQALMLWPTSDELHNMVRSVQKHAKPMICLCKLYTLSCPVPNRLSD